MSRFVGRRARAGLVVQRGGVIRMCVTLRGGEEGQAERGELWRAIESGRLKSARVFWERYLAQRQLRNLALAMPAESLLTRGERRGVRMRCNWDDDRIEFGAFPQKQDTWSRVRCECGGNWCAGRIWDGGVCPTSAA